DMLAFGMKALAVLCLLTFIAGASAQCEECKTMRWANCDGDSCACTVLVDNGLKQPLDCTKLIPKCYIMKAEMFRIRNKMSSRSIGGKPVEIVDNDDIYDPECEDDGRFKTVQCNGTETCWCVNSAGIRRSDKGDKNIKCEPAETYGIENAILSHYNIPKNFVSDVQYDKDTRVIVVDVIKDAVRDRDVDLPRMAYYLEQDIKALPLFKALTPFQLSVDGTKVLMMDILVNYIDDKPPTFTMKSLTGGVIATISVVVLAVVIILLCLVSRAPLHLYTLYMAFSGHLITQ
ncbi:hypothetical protein NFI96_027078, partial [Prochilodus magdalenae]